MSIPPIRAMVCGMRDSRPLLLLLIATSLLATSCASGERGDMAARIEVVRDQWGIAHVRADNEEALFFGAGVAMAEDRLLQMVIRRRAVQGRLAEILGPGAGGQIVKLDRRYRTIGFHRHAPAQLQSVDRDTRRNLNGFAAGINSYIQRNSARLAVELGRFGGVPEKWTAADSLAIWEFTGERFIAGWDQEALAKRQGSQKVDARAGVLPQAEWPNPDDSAEIVSEDEFRRQAPEIYERLKKRKRTPAPLIRHNPLAIDIKASHNWAVSGALSTTGKPLLESDPQYTVQNPSFAYEIHLEGGRYNTRGLCIAGTPGFLIGWNSRCAWGVTALGGDNADLFEEKTNPDNPLQYLSHGEWKEFQVRREVISIKGRSPIELQVRITDHGPVVNDLVEGVQPGEVYSLRLPPLVSPKTSLEAMLKLMRASDWPSFRRALSGYVSPPAHFVYADADGNIGYQAAVQTPVRYLLDPLPRQGWKPESEWEMIDFEELPFLFNPRRNFVFTANHLAAGSWYPYPVGVGRGDGPRSLRLRELVTADRRYSAADFLTIHRDSVNPVIRDFVRFAVQIAREDRVQNRDLDAALPVLEKWDGRLLTDSAAYPIAAGLLETLTEHMSDTWLMGYGGTWPGVCKMSKDLNAEWQRTGHAPADPEMRAWLVDLLANAIRKAARAHQPGTAGVIHHMPYQDNNLGLGSLAPENDLDSPPLRCPITQTIWSQVGAMYVQIVDFSNLDQSLSLLPPGISEKSSSLHFKDQMEMWQRGQLHQAPLSRDGVDKVKRSAVYIEYSPGVEP